MDRMDMGYTKVMGDMYRFVNIAQPRPGNVFYRAMVIRVVDSSVVRLFFLDYGTMDNQKVKHCRFPHKQFVSLPVIMIWMLAISWSWRGWWLSGRCGMWRRRM